MGPRRVGKTVMMFHTIQRLINSGVSAQNIIYISVETPIYNKIYLEQLFILACQILGKNPTQEQMYVFYDEIQYLKECSRTYQGVGNGCHLFFRSAQDASTRD